MAASIRYGGVLRSEGEGEGGEVASSTSLYHTVLPPRQGIARGRGEQEGKEKGG